MKLKHKTIPIFVPHWGCPQNCSFCNQKTITSMKEKMTVEKAVTIIEQGVANKQPEDYVEIGFFGGSFTGVSVSDQEELLGLAQQYVLSGQVDTIRLSTRPDYIDDEVLKRLTSFGVTTVELGAQSMNDDVLKKNNRGHTAETSRLSARKIKDAGLSLGLQMMLGLPGDTEESSIQTAKEFISLKPDCVRIYPTLVLKDTELAHMFLKDDYKPLELFKAVEQCSKLYQMFVDSNIDVIRMGLVDVEEDGILAGPYHPAFGELVMGRVFFDKMSELLRDFSGNTVCFSVHPQDISAAVGQKKVNVLKLKEKFSLKEINFQQDNSLIRGEIQMN